MDKVRNEPKDINTEKLKEVQSRVYGEESPRKEQIFMFGRRVWRRGKGHNKKRYRE